MSALARDHFLQPLPSNAPGTDSLTAFLRPKTSEKACFIAELRILNDLTPLPLPKFSLPTLEDLQELLQHHPQNYFWGATVDITNFYWSLRIPPSAHTYFRIQSLSFDSLPFGWNLSPVIAQQTLGFIIDGALLKFGVLPLLHRSLFIYRYLDDILIVSPNLHFLSYFMTDFKAYLSSQQLMVSPKSILQPTRLLVWLGKQINFTTRTITLTTNALMRLFGLAILFPLLPLHKKLLQRVAGVFLWTGRPIRGTTIFLAPLYNRIYPPSSLPKLRFFGHAANTACRSILDFAAISSIGWTAQGHDPLMSNVQTIFVDAAQNGDLFHIGLFIPNQGIQIHVAPPSIANQQMAELFALAYGIKLATSLRCTEIHLVNDNRGALFSLLSMQPRAANYPQMKLLRQIFNALWWSHLTVKLFWVPSFLNPADPPSRLFSFLNPSPFQAWSMAVHIHKNLEGASALPYPMGTLQL